MKSIKNKITKTILLLLFGTGIAVSSCSKTESYSELLREEEKAVNWYLAARQIELNIPSDSISFKTGKDAPFYKLDEEGYVYMQVINKGELNPSTGRPVNKVKPGDLVYFRFLRQNILSLYRGEDAPWSGNSSDVDYSEATSFVYKNTYLSSSTSWGTGIQLPLKFLGYGSEVNLVLKSYTGFMADQTYCVPYIINVRYFKPEY